MTAYSFYSRTGSPRYGHFQDFFPPRKISFDLSAVAAAVVQWSDTIYLGTYIYYGTHRTHLCLPGASDVRERENVFITDLGFVVVFNPNETTHVYPRRTRFIFPRSPKTFYYVHLPHHKRRHASILFRLMTHPERHVYLSIRFLKIKIKYPTTIRYFVRFPRRSDAISSAARRGVFVRVYIYHYVPPLCVTFVGTGPFNFVTIRQPQNIIRIYIPPVRKTLARRKKKKNVIKK